MNTIPVSIDDLYTMAEDTARAMAQIRLQIDTAKSDSVTGIYSDPDWFRRANYALKMKGIEHQRLMREMGKKKEEERKARASTYERLFEQEAKKILSVETYREIQDKVFNLMNKE